MQSTIRQKLDQLAERHQELEHLLASAEVLGDPKRLREISREHAQLGPLASALREAGTVTVDRNDGLAVVDLLIAAGLAASKGEARRTIGEGGAYVNNVRVEDAEAVVAEGDLVDGTWLVLRRGKKRFAGVEVL